MTTMTAKHEQIDGLDFAVLVLGDNGRETMYIPFDEIDNLISQLQSAKDHKLIYDRQNETPKQALKRLNKADQFIDSLCRHNVHGVELSNNEYND